MPHHVAFAGCDRWPGFDYMPLLQGPAAHAAHDDVGGHTGFLLPCCVNIEGASHVTQVRESIQTLAAASLQKLWPAVYLVDIPGLQTSRLQRRPGCVPACVLRPEVVQVVVKTKTCQQRAALLSKLDFSNPPKTQGFCAQGPSVSRKVKACMCPKCHAHQCFRMGGGKPGVLVV